MSFPNPTAATQGRGFGTNARTGIVRMTRPLRNVLTLAAFAAAALGSVGCRSVPTAGYDGSTARIVAAVGAALDTHDRPYERGASPERGVLLAGTR